MSAVKRPELARAGLVALLFLGLASVSIARVLEHALWRDEAQALLLVRASSSVQSIVDKLRFEAHPPAWYLLLYALKQVSSSARAMQILVGLIAAATWTRLLTIRALPLWQ